LADAHSIAARPEQVNVGIEAVEMDLDDRGNLVVGLQFDPPCAHSAYELKVCVQAARESGIS